jgi:hypothetical protein
MAGPRPSRPFMPSTRENVIAAIAALSCSVPELAASAADRRKVLRRTAGGSRTARTIFAAASPRYTS